MLKERVYLFDPTIGRSCFFYLVDIVGDKAVYESEESGWRILIPLDDPIIQA